MGPPVNRRVRATPPAGPATVTATVEALELAALRYLARRDRTEAQLRAHLLSKGASSTSLRLVIRRLQDRGYVNDEAYARRWAERRLAQRPVGRERLEAELSSRGIPSAIVREVLDPLYREHDEAHLARRLLAYRRVGAKPGQMDSRSFVALERLLRRQGFGPETIATVLGMPDDDMVEERGERGTS